MNRKIKSLLVAGLLVVGMSGNVFAYNTFEGNDSNTSIVSEQHNGLTESKIDDPAPGDSYTLQDGNITVTINEDGKSATVTVKNGSPVEVKFVHMKGGNGFNCYVAGSDSFSGMVCPEGKDISHITVVFDHVDKTDTDDDSVPDYKDDEPTTPPTDPDDPVEPPTDPDEPVEPPTDPDEPEEKDPTITDPETGDSSIMVYGGITVASAVLAYTLNKKKDE